MDEGLKKCHGSKTPAGLIGVCLLAWAARIVSKVGRYFDGHDFPLRRALQCGSLGTLEHLVARAHV